MTDILVWFGLVCGVLLSSGGASVGVFFIVLKLKLSCLV